MVAGGGWTVLMFVTTSSLETLSCNEACLDGNKSLLT